MGEAVRQTALADSALTFLVPASLRPDTTALFIHGGRGWVDSDSTRLNEVYGIWGEDSFGSAEEDKASGYSSWDCETTVAGYPVYLRLSWAKGEWYGGSAWVRGVGYYSYELALGAGGRDRAAVDLLLSVLASLRQD